MKFEPYAREWLSRQTLIKSTRKTTRQSMEVYAFPVIGQLEIADITENDIDEIFFSERLFNRKGDFMERVFRVLLDVFYTGPPVKTTSEKIIVNIGVLS